MQQRQTTQCGSVVILLIVCFFTADVFGDARTGEYVDFMTGFVTHGGSVWGRPVAVATSRDGALFVSDDGGNVIWRVSYTGVNSTSARTDKQ